MQCSVSNILLLSRTFFGFLWMFVLGLGWRKLYSSFTNFLWLLRFNLRTPYTRLLLPLKQVRSWYVLLRLSLRQHLMNLGIFLWKIKVFLWWKWCKVRAEDHQVASSAICLDPFSLSGLDIHIWRTIHLQIWWAIIDFHAWPFTFYPLLSWKLFFLWKMPNVAICALGDNKNMCKHEDWNNILYIWESIKNVGNLPCQYLILLSKSIIVSL